MGIMVCIHVGFRITHYNLHTYVRFAYWMSTYSVFKLRILKYNKLFVLYKNGFISDYWLYLIELKNECESTI